jgi:hypothetical protein
MKKRVASTTLFLALLIGASFGGSVQTESVAAGLGISVRVIPGGNQVGQEAVGANKRMWMIVKQGDSRSREIEISSTSDISQLISLSIVDAAIINGVTSAGKTLNEANSWAKFSDNNFVLPPSSRKKVSMEISIPKGISDRAVEAYIVTTAESPKPTGAETNSNYKAVIKGQARFAHGLFLGVGDYEKYRVNFSIDDVKDSLRKGQKKLQIFMNNKGLTPIAPSGDVTLQNADFPDLRFGPIKYLTARINPASKAVFVVDLPEDVIPGKWKIFVKASQGNVTETKVFEKTLRFSQWFDIIFNVGRILLFVIGIILLRKSWHLFRGTTPSPQPLTTKAHNLLRFLRARVNSRPKLVKSQSGRFETDIDAEIERMLEEIRAQKKKASPKKASPKKASPKKASPKKASPKKASPKKASPKKASPKRAAPKKSRAN